MQSRYALLWGDLAKRQLLLLLCVSLGKWVACACVFSETAKAQKISHYEPVLDGGLGMHLPPLELSAFASSKALFFARASL
jgi:hypothetical protein